MGKVDQSWYELHHNHGRNTTTCCAEQDDKSTAQISQKIQKAYSKQPELG